MAQERNEALAADGAFHLLHMQLNVPQACPYASAIVAVERQMSMPAAGRGIRRLAQYASDEYLLNHAEEQLEYFAKGLLFIDGRDRLDYFIQGKSVF